VATDRTAEALADLEGAVALARQIGDPALFLRGASVLLGFGGTEVLAAEAHAVTDGPILTMPFDGRAFRASTLKWRRSRSRPVPSARVSA